jgi:16S rRNA (cytosine1402-N4)-methyltransferase
MTHTPVLLNEVVKAIGPADGELIVDATFGGGGYARAILEAAEGCRVIGIDRDPEAVRRGEAFARLASGRLSIRHGRFGDLDAILPEAQDGPLDAVMFDLGVSSFQLDTAERGFSFRFDGPLDMRMDAAGPTAADVLAAFSEVALADAIWSYGEEPAARRIAKALIEARRASPLTSTLQLAELVEKALGGRNGARTHPATRTFQALRIVVNDELGEICRGLTAAEARLRPGGRLAVVTFHSLEDRLVKTCLKERAEAKPQGSRYRPSEQTAFTPSFTLQARKPVEPGPVEVAANPRARSARLRAAIRTEGAAFAPFSPRSLAPLAAEEWERLAA